MAVAKYIFKDPVDVIRAVKAIQNILTEEIFKDYDMKGDKIRKLAFNWELIDFKDFLKIVIDHESIEIEVLQQCTSLNKTDVNLIERIEHVLEALSDGVEYNTIPICLEAAIEEIEEKEKKTELYLTKTLK